MTRVDALQKKYPSLAREILVKWEVLRHGIRDSDAVYENGFWIRAAGGYHSLDHGVTLQDVTKKRPDAVRPGYVFLPGVFYMKNGIGARIERDVNSPYVVRETREGEYALFEGEEKIEDVYFSGPRPWGDDLFTSKGTPATSLVTTRGRCFALAPLRYCEFFDKGEDCKFCNYNYTHHETRSL
ncbi:MAG: hypothetical protein Q7O66_21515, partial [Dehalococcoidia bacterium]|nr:hypothetical protein [Dehalococcoidia bacterium]